ncbi:collagenase [Streptomyces lydicamycinicus]|uniref:microbial collagenase n=1 Tax=Streptomyces lydicamycinicus TaxID=1546107 RepID=A0A0P4R4S6_9ACTN|nr:collagenase [Streptomyces lydicamycinicus]GAO07857.1 putative peptidase M9 family protein [Streptomyces lydicamycinicus]
MSHSPTPRRILLAATLVTALALPVVQSAQAAPHAPATPAQQLAQRAAAPTPNPFDHAQRLARTPKLSPSPAPAPRSLTERGRIPGPQTRPAAGSPGSRPAVAPCTLDGITGLSPERFADFLADPAVTADDCLRKLVWTWDARLIPVMSDAHVQAVARRITGLAAAHDGKNSSHLYEMFTYLHAVAYQDFSHDEIDITDGPTVDAIRRAVDAFAAAARTFDVTRTNADTLREALYAASAPGLRQHQLGLIRKVLATMDPSHTATHKDPAWGNAALAALSVNYLGVYPGNQDTAFQAAVTADPGYRAVFKGFVGYTHLKGTPNAWVVRDALSEYGRFGEIASLKPGIITDLGVLLPTTVRNYGEGSEPWAKIASWLNYFGACAPYKVCKADIEKRIFPRTYSYDNGAIKVRTALDRATVDQLYYASKQVRAQFHRVVGTTEPLAGDPNTTLNIVLYASRADYEIYHPLLTGMGTNNGGVYIERGATFYTYQRRVPQDSTLTLEELFRHEYVHYLNGRFAVPGFFGEGPWYQGDRTTAMDEGSAEFFDGSTRDDGIAVRRSLVKGIIADTAGGGPRMSINQLLHATYDGDGFRFYNYAGTFFEFLWRDHPGKLQEMYRHLRADDPAAFDSWRNRMGSDPGLQQQYDAFLNAQIAIVDDLFVPKTVFVPNGSLKLSRPADVQSAFTAATAARPICKDGGDPAYGRFICTGRITANLSNSGSPDQVFKDMAETVDYFILDRAEPAANNFADMNCSFGPTEIWSSGKAGTADFSCEGPLRR